MTRRSKRPVRSPEGLWGDSLAGLVRALNQGDLESARRESLGLRQVPEAWFYADVSRVALLGVEGDFRAAADLLGVLIGKLEAAETARAGSARDPAAARPRRQLVNLLLAEALVGAGEAGQLPPDIYVAGTRAALADVPDYARTETVEATLAALAGDYEQAAVLAQQALRRADGTIERADALLTLALARAGQGDRNAARQHLSDTRLAAPWYGRIQHTARRIDSIQAESERAAH